MNDQDSDKQQTPAPEPPAPADERADAMTEAAFEVQSDEDQEFKPAEEKNPE